MPGPWITPDPVTVPAVLGATIETDDHELPGYVIYDGVPFVGDVGTVDQWWPEYAQPRPGNALAMKRRAAGGFPGISGQALGTTPLGRLSVEAARYPMRTAVFVAAPVIPEWAMGNVELEEPYGTPISADYEITVNVQTTVTAEQPYTVQSWDGVPFTATVKSYVYQPGRPERLLYPNLSELGAMTPVYGEPSGIVEAGPIAAGGVMVWDPQTPYDRAHGSSSGVGRVIVDDPDQFVSEREGEFFHETVIPDISLLHEQYPQLPMLQPPQASPTLAFNMSAWADITVAGTVTYQPPRYRLLTQGAWRTRQRQSVGADGWPIRQRQNSSYSGSWDLRQRQKRT